ncbi:MAG: globin domain-containing protein [Cumulibacter sp.]
MLSPESVSIVKATLPVIGAAIDDITPIFYRRMFTAHPELERDLFNRGNQAQGTQQRALAASIAAYATMLIDEGGPDPRQVLSRIAHKHASLGIKPDQYPIVHEHLFAAIVEVLGEAVTPPIAAAWNEVYWNMAQTLIEIERDLYAETGVHTGDVWRRLVVRARVQQAPDTVAFVMASPDGRALPTPKPGQYVSVAVVLPDGARQIRQYSVTQVGFDAVEFSVKRIVALADAPAGEVSNFLHDNVFEGDEIEVSAPFGELTLTDSDDPLLLISAGIGVTPMIGFLNFLLRTGSTRRVHVLHADRTPARHAHRAELKELVAALPEASLHRWYEELGARPAHDLLRTGYIDIADLDLPEAADIYLCGPLPFMGSVRSSLRARGIPAERIHYEIFGPSHDLEFV